MKIIHISDTHSQHEKIGYLSSTDIIIHSGDISISNTEREVHNFLKWFCNLPYKYKIFIAGNHDVQLYEANIEGLTKNCYYLCNSGVEIGGLKFYGVPLFMADIHSGEYEKHIQNIPIDTDILITHQPPFTILDTTKNRHFGAPNLFEKVMEIKPKYHLFGHVHSFYGTREIDGIHFVNSAVVNEHYEVRNLPREIKIKN